MGIALHRKLLGVSFAYDVKDARTSKSLRFFRRRKAIIGGELRIAFKCSELHRVIRWPLVVRATKFMLE